MKIKAIAKKQGDYAILLLSDLSDSLVEEMNDIMSEDAAESGSEYTPIEEETNVELEAKINLTDFSMELFDTKSKNCITQYDKNTLHPITAAIRAFLTFDKTDVQEAKLVPYRTNAKCSRCKNPLYTFDYIGDYPLVCQNCEEDFFFWESPVNIPATGLQVWIPSEPLSWGNIQRYLYINEVISGLNAEVQTTYDNMRESLRIDLPSGLETRAFQGIILWVVALLEKELLLR